MPDTVVLPGAAVVLFFTGIPYDILDSVSNRQHPHRYTSNTRSLRSASFALVHTAAIDFRPGLLEPEGILHPLGRATAA